MSYFVFEVLVALAGPYFIPVLVQQLEKHQQVVAALILGKSHGANCKSAGQTRGGSVYMIEVRVVDCRVQLVHLRIFQFGLPMQFMSVDSAGKYFHLCHRSMAIQFMVANCHKLSTI